MDHVGRSVLCCLGILVLCGSATATSSLNDSPTPVSPGDTRFAVDTEQRCPTFSWGAVDGAVGYELVVFEVDGLPTASAPPGLADRRSIRELAGREPRIHVQLPGSATSWTPSSSQCLDPDVRYVWFIREAEASRSFPGNWSEPASFRIDTAGNSGKRALDAEAADAGAVDVRANPGSGSTASGTGGIPAVLAQLELIQQMIAANDARFDRLEAQMATNQALLNQRFDDVEASLTRLDDIPAILEEVTPCTIDRFRAGECEVLGGEASVCFTIDLGAEVGLSYAVEPGYTLQAGGSVHWLPNGEFSAGLETPLVGLVPLSLLPVAYPDVSAGASIGAGGSVEICVANVSFPIGGGRASLDDFVQQLVDALQLRGDEIAQTAASIATERKLDPGKLADAMNALQAFEPGPLEVNGGPLDLFKPNGELRGLVDALPAFDNDDGSRTVSDMFDNIGDLIPDLDPRDSLAICDNDHLSMLGELRPKVEDLCSLLDIMPNLADLAESVKSLPSEAADQICEAVPSLNCSGDSLESVRQCRRGCRSDARDCRGDCGPFDFSCRRQCEQTKDACIDSCSGNRTPGSVSGVAIQEGIEPARREALR